MIKPTNIRFRSSIATYGCRALLFSLLMMSAIATRADKVDDYIQDQMRRCNVPGLSLAIIQDGKIVKAKGYGVVEHGSRTPVTPSTLFQAASISKSVSAAATQVNITLS